MEDQLAIIIEAGIGLAGFAGVTVVLSGSPETWSPAEKLRVSSMLIAIFSSVFCALLSVTLAQLVSDDMAVRLGAVVAALCAMSTVSRFLLIAGKRIGWDEPTLNRTIATAFSMCSYIFGFFAIGGALGVASNVSFWFFLVLVWLLFGGAVLFIRILFVRPGSTLEKPTD